MSQRIQTASVPDGAQTWRGREAFEVSNGTFACKVLRRGGVLAEARFTGAGEKQNLIWESPWIGPEIALDDMELAARYGDANSGRFLHHYTGHALCLDGFGPASEDQFAQGVGLHGEATQVQWRIERAAGNEIHAEALLPVAQLTVQRKFKLLPEESVLRVEEVVRNAGASSRNVHWVQHATVGAPAFGNGAHMATSAREGLTWPLDYEGKNALQPDTCFTFPLAQGWRGEAIDLSALFPIAHRGFVAALKQPADRTFGFIAVHDQSAGVVLAYVYPASVFPWITLWEENKARDASPWNGAVQARGLEFGTTPFPLGNDAVDAQGLVLGAPTSHRMQPGQAVTACWLLAAAHVPAEHGRLTDIQVEDNALVLCCAHSDHRVSAAGVASFLATGEQA